MPGRLSPRRWLSLIFMVSVLFHDAPFLPKQLSFLAERPLARASLAALPAVPAAAAEAPGLTGEPEEEPLPDADAIIVPPEETQFLSPEEVPAPEEARPARRQPAGGRPRAAVGVDAAGALPRADLGGSVPWPARGYISSRYGWRRGEFHRGVDIAGRYGSEVRAVAPGVVTLAAWYYGYGRVVVIRHGDGSETLYGHNSRVLVSAGQRVERGELIALMGCSGRCTGPHVHFEVRVGGRAVNPMRYLR